MPKMKPLILLIIVALLLAPGCGTILQIQEEGLVPFGGVRLDCIGIFVGLVGIHPIGLLAILDLPFSLVADLLLFFPSFLFGGDYLPASNLMPGPY